MSTPRGSHRGARRRSARRTAAPRPGRSPGGTTAAPAPEHPGRAAARRAAHRRPPEAEFPAAGLVRLVPQALVVAILAGGTSAFVSYDKAVRLSVDGVPRTLHTFAGDVADLLEQQHVEFGEHDIVAPDPRAALRSGDEVIVRYGRRPLDLDGERRGVWTTATTVREALLQLGVRAEGAYVSASRDARIGRHGLHLDVRTERTVTFLVDGRRVPLRTRASTVREALGEAGIELAGQDTTSAAPSSFPRDGQTISVLRITGNNSTREEPVAYETVRRDDPSLFVGERVVVTRGKEGVKRVTYAHRVINGVRQRPKRLGEETIRPPVTEVVKIGTRRLPTTVDGAEALNWDGLAQCESGGRPEAVDPSGTHGGLYQFDAQTWHGLGGSGRPQDAPAGEQTYRAKRLYVQRGASPWPACGRRLFS